MKKNPVLGVFILLIFATLASAGDAARLKMDLSTGEFYVNMPKSGANTLSITQDDIDNIGVGQGPASFKLYDDGGKDAPFTFKTEGLLELVAPEGYHFLIAGQVQTYLANFWVCEGANCGYGATNVTKLIDKYCDGHRRYNTAGEEALDIYDLSTQSSGNVMTVYFRDEGYTSYDNSKGFGLDFVVYIVENNKEYNYTVTCAKNVIGGSITCPENAIVKYGDVVTVTTTPAEGYVLAGVEVRGADGYPRQVEGGKWYSNNTASFQMPLTNVTVTPIFTDNLFNLDILMPRNERLEVVIPPNVTSFKFYDDGGKDGKYDSQKTESTLLLTAPEGNIIQVAGRIKVPHNRYDYLEINDVQENKKYYPVKTSDLGLNDNLFLLSSGNALEFYWHAQSPYDNVNSRVDNDEGFDFKVTVGEKIEHSITCKNSGVVGGSIACPENKNVKAGDVVSLTATPTAGYVFTGVKIEDAKGKVADLVDGVWGGNNKVSFKMPLSDVTVTPLFSNEVSDFYINMRRDTMLTFFIPPEVTSFKVYDNGGKDRRYSTYTTQILHEYYLRDYTQQTRVTSYGLDSLLLVAPEGFLLKVTGSSNLCSRSSYDSLLICDGRDCSVQFDNRSYHRTDKTKRLLKQGGGSNNDIALLSSSNALMLQSNFKNSGAVTGSYSCEDVGYGFTVELVENILHKVNCVSVSGGALEGCPEGDVNFATNITLTAKSDNMVLKSVDVVPKEDNIFGVTNGVFNVTGGTWYNNTISFDMPYSDVTVKPLFGLPVNLHVDMPVSGTLEVNIPVYVTSFKVYDDGGAMGDHAESYATGYLLLKAPNSNYVLQVTGSMSSDASLRLCDGSSCSSASKRYTGNVDDISFVSSESQLMIDFSKTSGTNKKGFDLNVNVLKKVRHTITCNSVEGGSFRCPGNSSIDVGKNITLKAIPNSGYTLTGYSVQDDEGNVLQSVEIPWYSENNEISMTMPYANISVTPIFTKVADLYIDMPTSGTLNIPSIPAGVTSFHVYDDGGKDGNYSKNMSSTLQLPHPGDGKLFVVTGSMVVLEDDELDFHDGVEDDAAYVGSSENINYVTGNSASINFSANSASSMATVTAAGIDLEVRVVESVEHAIVCGSADGGELSCSKDKAKVGETISLVATPAEGYVLSGIEVKDVNQKMVSVEGGKWYENTASFKMPLQGVTVTPTFVETKNLNPYINMPMIYDKTIYIPDGVNTFKIYDDGGEDGPYSKNKYGKMYLSVPLNHVVKVAGSLESDNDVFLYVSDDATSNEWNSSMASADINVSLDGNKNPYIYFSAGNGSIIGENAAAGLDLTVTLLNKKDFDYTISCDDGVEGGTFVCDKVVAKPEEIVKLTVTPSGDNKLAAVGIECENLDDIKNIEFDGNIVSFPMPYSNIKVSPVFVSDLANTFLNMPTGKNSRIFAISPDLHSFKLYDDGGSQNDYSNSLNGYTQLIVPKGSVFKLSGTAETESRYDRLTVYDGGSGADKLVDAMSGNFNFSKANPLESSGNILTFYFFSDGLVSKSGFNFLVMIANSVEYTVACDASVVGGTYTCDKAKGKGWDFVTMTATPDDGYVLWGGEVSDANQNSVPIEESEIWYLNPPSNTKLSFVMPFADVVAKPVFAKTSDLYVNMPASEGYDWKEIYIPEGVMSFKVYDDGGKGENYTANRDGGLDVYVPDGYIAQVTGTMEADDNSRLDIGYISQKGTFYSLFDKTGNQSDINVVLDKSGWFYIEFKTDPSGNVAAGLDLTVTLLKKEDFDFSISCDASVEGGTYGCDKEKGKGGDIVRLTATPVDGYIFAGVEFEDISKTAVFENVSFDGNTVSFAMPYSNITVKPVFTKDIDDLSIKMPLVWMNAVCFSPKVHGFHVYDDGGKDEKYNYSEGALQLIAPNGYVLGMWGNVNVDSYNDTLVIFNGGVNGDTLLKNQDKNWSDSYWAFIDGLPFMQPLLTLDFYASGKSYSSKGIDITVDIFENDEYTISCVEHVEGGSIVCDKDKAMGKESVTITATPEDGYYFDGFVIKDDDQNVLDESHWFLHPLNTDAFVVPFSNVTVVPTFTKKNQLSIVMPQTDWFYYGKPVTAYIPEGVNQLHVYDDGGKDGDYSAYFTSFVRLVAPKGYGFQLTGSLIVNDGDAFWAFGSSLDEFTYYGFSAPYNGYDSMDDIHYNFIQSEELYIFLVAYGSPAAGLDLTVTLVKRENAAVEIQQKDGKAIAVLDGEYSGTDAIDIPNDIEVDKVTLDREFPTDMSGFSTLMLPFDVDATDLEGVKSVIEFNGIFDNDGHDAVGMVYVWCNENIGTSRVALGYADCNKYEGKLKAYTPYMVEMESKTIGFKGGVTLKASRKTSGEPVETGVSKDEWTFQGMLQTKVFTEDETKNGNVWGYAGQDRDGAKIGKYVQFGAGAWINPLRAYLLKSSKKTDGEPQDDSQLAPKASFIARRAMESMLDESGRLVVADRTAVAGTETASIGGMEVVIVEQDKDGNAHTTVIGRYDSRTGELRMDFRPKHTYDLKGRRVNEGRKAKGAYYGKNVKK